MKKIIVLFLVVGVIAGLVACGTDAVETMNTTDEQQQQQEDVQGSLDEKYKDFRQDKSFPEDIETTEVEERLEKDFYGTWYSNSGETLEVGKFTINGETYRVTEVCFDEESSIESVSFQIADQYEQSYYLDMRPIMTNPSKTKEMRHIGYGINGDGDIGTYFDLPPEEQKEFYTQQQPSTQDGGSIDDSTIKACYDDAIEQFKDWFLTNYSSSLADYACYSRQGDYKVQQSSSSVTITFDMSARDIADPTGPIFTVVANYSVENGKVNRFSFDCNVSY